MGISIFVVVLAAVSLGERIPASEIEHQQAAFQELWDDDFTWKLDALPQKGGVPDHRIPYSGYIYPDKQGGTIDVLRLYDRAFHGGRKLAQDHERWDSSAFKEKVPGLFGDVFGVKHTPGWYGHCNGWTSAAIRHAEPRRSVVRNGVTFSPADIKGLMAELYIYNEHIVLGGENEAPITAGVFHAILANWLGRREHALGMEADPGEEKWNYPAYAFASTFAKHSDRRIEVNTNLVYALDSNGEWDESPRIQEVKFFHYMLELNGEGEIIGGYFFRDSSSIDMLWAPMPARTPGKPGNEEGNPYLEVEKVLAIWRDSVPQEVRSQWSDLRWQSEASESMLSTPVDVLVVDIDEADTEPDRRQSNSTTISSVPRLPKYIVVPKPTEGRNLPRVIRPESSEHFDLLLDGSPL
ncbi:MAG: hypothetical protein CMJ64_15855 [Planctomycetaceae bacterium]|nr:hypothetical protein [Planctomycetaceae bacterium]